MSSVAENLNRVRQRIEQAAHQAGRRADEITLVAVTKYAEIDAARELVEAGCADLGESRPQELWRKAESQEIPDVRWHMIGHMQRNKLRRTLSIPTLTCIHSVDSRRLLDSIEAEAAKLDREIDVLLEVKISDDPTKHGFSESEVMEVIPHATAMKHTHLRGLMGMASREGGVDQARREFSQLRSLRDRLHQSIDPQRQLAELSMGMSNDFEAAILEGSTMIRVGSALVG